MINFESKTEAIHNVFRKACRMKKVVEYFPKNLHTKIEVSKPKCKFCTNNQMFC